MSFEKISTKDAPQAIGPYSQAVRVGAFIYCSGQIPLNPSTGDLLTGTIEEETERVIKNIDGILKACGASLRSVVKTTIFLKDMNQFAKVNETYARFFSEPYPARSTVEVARLPKDVRIEIEAIAHVS